MSFSTPVENIVDKPSRVPVVAGVVAFVVALIAVGETFGYLRAVIALGVFLLLFSFGFRQIRSLASAPPEPELADVGEYGLRYVCTMCGLELKVEVAARDKAPTHCMEPMKLVRVGGTPPLSSV
ncbi:MAG TPA: hypothetical protein VG408_07765 [Actinomycetota bacterium]|nr:hypothetical protein [Actinomycetota bacterium]